MKASYNKIKVGIKFRFQGYSWQITSIGAITRVGQMYGVTCLRTGAFISMSESELVELI